MNRYAILSQLPLPPDVCGVIHAHCCALVVQSAWKRFWFWGYTRTGVQWRRLRARLDALGYWRSLLPFPQVRREWRLEPHSWLSTHASVFPVILREAHAGMWGDPGRFPQTDNAGNGKLSVSKTPSNRVSC